MKSKNDHIVYLAATDKEVEETEVRDSVDGEISSISG
jgi:hypothetical protein